MDRLRAVLSIRRCGAKSRSPSRPRAAALRPCSGGHRGRSPPSDSGLEFT
jgi:hypothetical protein